MISKRRWQTEPRAFPWSKAKNEEVQKFQGRDFHLDVETFHFVAEIVVTPQSGYGNEQAQGGGEEGFGNSFDGRGDTDPSRRAAALKGIVDADDRAEQAD